MENLAFLAPLLFIAGAAVIVLAIIAVVQDMKQDRKYGYRQAFYTIVSLVMLVMVVGAGVSLITIGLKQALPAAREYAGRNNMPPAPYLTGIPEKSIGVTTAYTCAKECEFSAADKQNIADWKTQYTQWKSTNQTSLQLRRDLAGALALLLVALPVYGMFMRWMNRGAKEEMQLHARPSPLRSVYFYGIAFAGLVMAVVGGAMLLNTGLKSILHTGSSDTTIAASRPTTNNIAYDSMIACQSTCGFTAEDIALVQDWKTQNDAFLARQATSTSSTANDFATSIPFVAVGAPLFWLHFSRIRKETSTPVSPAQTA